VPDVGCAENHFNLLSGFDTVPTDTKS